MGFKDNKKRYMQKPEKKPVRLTFGLIEDPAKKEVKPPPLAQPQYEKQEIIGTLYLKKINLDKVPPLSEKNIDRITKNLSKIYEEGRYLKTNTVIDSEGEILLITFNYNQNTIDRIKGLDRNERQWDPENKLWRVYISCFDDLFDILGKGFRLTEKAYNEISKFIKTSYYAYVAPGKLGKLILRESWFEEFDFSLQAIPENKNEEDKKIKDQIANFLFKRKPYSHQLTGIAFLMQNPHCALLDEMGCGKSFQIASAVALLLKNKAIDRCLIVCPKSLVRTWQEELKLATSTPFTVIEGTITQRAKLLSADTPIFIIHYEGLRLEKEPLAEWIEKGDSMLVFDESQRIKNISAQTTLSAKYISKFTKRCVIATGTPIANRPIDLFAQYYVMDDGVTFGTSFLKFKNTFCYIDIIEIHQGRRKIKVEKFVGVRNGEELRKRIQATSLRRLKSEVLDLPPIIFKDYSIELRPEQKIIYANMRDSVRSEIESMSGAEFALQSKNIIVRLLRLSQIASNPKLINEKYAGSNAKFAELDELLSDIFSDETKKVILWSHFVENVTELLNFYAETWGAVAHTGEMHIEKRAHSIKEFQDNPACRLFIATPQSAKEGLTLLPKDGVMKADTMIYLDLNFDAGSYIQSQARFHRIGQNAEKCLVIHLVAVDTIDEYIKKMIINKIETAVQILDNKSLEDIGMNADNYQLSQEEILRVL